jgi:uncharacterized caspase-like protein
VRDGEPRDSSSDTQLDIVLAGDLLYGAISPPREITRAKFAVKPKLFALPVAAALSILFAAAFAGGTLATNYTSATNQSSQQASQTRGVALEQETKAQVASELSGHYYALVIGINNYQHLQKLGTAVQDAQALASILHDQYGFQTTPLLDATHDQIMKAMNDYRHSLDENASLLIYYAGHGYYDRDADKAYWLPVDADRDDNSHWIMAESITTAAKVIPARHVLIVSDSCYSGGLTRDIAVSYTPQERERYLAKMALGKSRTLMSSGALEPVADGGGGGHSVFTGALIKALATSSDSIVTAGGLFDQYVQVSVAGRSDQTPQYAPIRNSGHDFGDFVFVRSGKAPAPSAAQRTERSAAPAPQIVASQPAPSRQPAVPPRAAYNPPAAAPTEMRAKGVLASQTYGGIRFDVKSVNTNKSKAPVVQIAATNTEGRDIKFKILTPLDPKVIDSNGISNTWINVEGVPICGGGVARCATTDPNGWSVAYSGTPLNFVLNFSGTKDFRGSSASISFNVLLGTQRDDGTIKTSVVSVALPNVPLNPDAPVRTALANQTYGGIRFDVMSARVGEKAVNVLIAATNMQQRDLKFKIVTPLDPKVIDSNGISNTWINVEGVPVCGGGVARCATTDPNGWSVAYSGIPLEFVLPFTGTQEFHGSSASVSFNVLLGTERDDGTIKPTLVPVDLPNVPLNPDVPARAALANRTYEGIRFDVMSARVGEKAVNVLIAAKNTQQRDLKFKIVTPPDPKVIDSNGISNTWYVVEGVPVCGGGVARCATTDPNGWSVAYSGIPLEFVLPFTGTQEFRGSSISVSFNVLLGTEKDDGTIKATPVSVALPNVPLSQ